MRTLTDQEKLTVRFAAIGLGVYLALFFSFRAWTALEKKRAEYLSLAKQAETTRLDLQLYKDKAEVAQKLMDSFKLDPAKLVRATAVAEASAAIQRAGQSGGVVFGPIRESPAGPSSKELASMQLEGTGPVPAVMTLLHRLQSLGYPLIVDAIQISSEPSKPGMVKLNLTIVIMDFEQWKGEPPHA